MATATSTITPTKTGWHLVQFANGWAAVVRWAGATASEAAHWVWGSLTPPDSAITSVTYIAPTIADIATAGGDGQKLWGQAMTKVGAPQSTSFISALSEGQLYLGQPVLLNSKGQAAGGTDPNVIGSAVPSNIIPSPNIPNPLDILSTIWTWLTTAKNWLKPLEVIAGVVAIYLAIKSLTGINTPKISIAGAAKAVAK